MEQFNTAKVVLEFVIALGWLVVTLRVAAFVCLFTNVGLVGALSAFGILASGLIPVLVLFKVNALSGKCAVLWPCRKMDHKLIAGDDYCAACCLSFGPCK